MTSEAGMRSFWDEAARKNAAWYVDTSFDYANVDMGKFFETGTAIVAEALDDAPAHPEGHGTALEIGCGLGRVCLALAERFDNVIGIDISPEMVKRGSELVDRDNVELRVGDGASLAGVPDQSIDLVLSFTVFQHIPRVSVIESYIREAGRVLNPGGVMVFQWNNERGSSRMWSARRVILGFLQRSGLRRERHGRHAPQFLGSRIPLPRIERALESAGLSLVATNGTGSLFAWAWARKQ